MESCFPVDYANHILQGLVCVNDLNLILMALE